MFFFVWQNRLIFVTGVLQELGWFFLVISPSNETIWGDLMGSSLYAGLPFLATLKRMDVMHLDLYSE